jgi:hypothetical protein
MSVWIEVFLIAGIQLRPKPVKIIPETISHNQLLFDFVMILVWVLYP